MSFVRWCDEAHEDKKKTHAQHQVSQHGDESSSSSGGNYDPVADEAYRKADEAKMKAEDNLQKEKDMEEAAKYDEDDW
jgi:hypothetical protein